MKKMIWAVFVFSLAGVTASAQELSAANVSSYLGNSRWSWTIYLTGPKAALDKVSYVEYTLHPTFSNPVRRVDRTTDPRYPFGLTETGWGTFTVGIKVVFKNGQVRELTHMLQFVSASQSPCGSSIELWSQHMAFLADKRFEVPHVLIYVDEIRNEWTKIPPTLTLSYGPPPRLRGSEWMRLTFEADHFPGAFVPSGEFESAMKHFPSDSRWSITVQHEGDVMEFRYGGRYYLLTVVNVKAGLGDASHLDLQICERLPSAAR